MKQEQLRKMQQIISEDGDWSAHNIWLGGNNYTIKDGIVNDEYKLKRVISNIADFAGGDFSGLRILDLACLEGLFGIECARQGANVTLLDARPANLRKVEFTAEVLGLDNIEIVEDDVRAISREKYGEFDVILCFGIFYHLDKSDLYPFVQRMYEMTRGFVFFDTHITFARKESFSAGGRTYYGESYLEHRSDASAEEIESDLWKSIDNPRSFNMEKTSLLEMLADIGFTSVAESLVPYDPTKNRYRVSLIAKKGAPVEVISAPRLSSEKTPGFTRFTLGKAMTEAIAKAKTDMIYKFKINSPAFVRNFYKRYIKKGGKYKKV